MKKLKELLMLINRISTVEKNIMIIHSRITANIIISLLFYREVDIWTRSLELMKKYSVIRSGVKDLNKSVHFEKLININQYEYKLLPNLHKEMIEYMKILEWRLQEK